MEIRTGSSDRNSSLGESNSFEYNGDQMSRSMVGRKGQIKRDRTEETVLTTTSGYNLKPRSGKRVESRPTMEMRTQLGGPVRAGKSKGRNYNPYIEEQTRPGNKNTRRRGNQQQKDQERKRRSEY
ncbi:uncharacterized protein TNCV_3457261 [Trichonephila clavipes]|nr:uncharacterized protein TNCV_3457261 [Trichonephila clavipes]